MLFTIIPLPTYRLHDTTGDDLGVIEHPAPNLEPGDLVLLPDEPHPEDCIKNKDGRLTR